MIDPMRSNTQKGPTSSLESVMREIGVKEIETGKWSSMFQAGSCQVQPVSNASALDVQFGS